MLKYPITSKTGLYENSKLVFWYNYRFQWSSFLFTLFIFGFQTKKLRRTFWASLEVIKGNVTRCCQTDWHLEFRTGEDEGKTLAVDFRVVLKASLIKSCRTRKTVTKAPPLEFPFGIKASSLFRRSFSLLVSHFFFYFYIDMCSTFDCHLKHLWKNLPRGVSIPDLWLDLTNQAKRIILVDQTIEQQNLH